MVRHLTLLPTEPTAPIATSYDLLCWSRLGAAYDPDELTAAVEDSAARALPRLLPAGRGPAAAPCRGAVLARPRRPQAWVHGGRLVRGQRGVPPGHPRPRCAPRGRCRPPSCPTPASAPGARPAGPTTRTSSRCSGTCSSATRSRSPVDRAARSCGTWPSACTATRRCPTPTRRWRSGTAAGCGRSASPARRARRTAPSRRTCATPASPPSSRACAGSGGSTRRSSPSSTRSRDEPRCCRRSTGW